MSETGHAYRVSRTRAATVLMVCALTFRVSILVCRLLPLGHPIRVLSEAGERQIAELRRQAMIQHIVSKQTPWWEREMAMGAVGALVTFAMAGCSAGL